MPIPVAEVDAYLRLAGITDPDTKLKYLRLIRRMDLIEIQYLRDQMKKA